MFHTWFRLDRHDDPAPVDPAPVDPATDPKPPFDGDFNADRAAKLIENLRTDLAAMKAKQGTAAEDARKEIAAQVAKALGQGGDDPADPAELVAQIEQAQADAWRSGVELSVHRVAGQLGANADALLDSMAFVDTLDDLVDLDPRSKEFREALNAKVTEALTRNPSYKTGGPSTPRPDPGQGGRPATVTDFKTADTAAFKAELAKYKLRPHTY